MRKLFALSLIATTTSQWRYGKDKHRLRQRPVYCHRWLPRPSLSNLQGVISEIINLISKDNGRSLRSRTLWKKSHLKRSLYKTDSWPRPTNSLGCVRFGDGDQGSISLLFVTCSQRYLQPPLAKCCHVYLGLASCLVSWLPYQRSTPCSTLRDGCVKIHLFKFAVKIFYSTPVCKIAFQKYSAPTIESFRLMPLVCSLAQSDVK